MNKEVQKQKQEYQVLKEVFEKLGIDHTIETLKDDDNDHFIKIGNNLLGGVEFEFENGKFIGLIG